MTPIVPGNTFVSNFKEAMLLTLRSRPQLFSKRNGSAPLFLRWDLAPLSPQMPLTSSVLLVGCTRWRKFASPQR